MSGDVELNPGPNVTIQNEISFIDSDFILKYRMLRYGLKPLEVGGAGDCFFRSISHQLYGNSGYHHAIRTAGVHYLANNPKRLSRAL